MSGRSTSVDLSKLSGLGLALHNACQTADTHAVKQLIESAVKTGDLSFVRFLMDNGAKPKTDAVLIAATRGDIEILRLLLIPVKATLSRLQRNTLANVLENATSQGQVGTAGLLMVFRDRIEDECWNECVEAGFTAAVERGDVASAHVLLEWRTEELTTALKIIANCQQFEILHEVLRLRQFSRKAVTMALSPVAAAGDLESLDLLLDKDAKDDGEALRVAAKHCYSAIIERLLQRLQYPAAAKGRALYEATTSGDLDSVNLLLDNDAELGDALQAAARLDQVQVMLILIARCNPDPNVLSAAISVAMFAWGRRQELNRLNVLAEQEEPEQTPGLALEPEGVTLLQAQGARLPDHVRLRMMEFMIILGNEVGVQSLLSTLPASEIEPDTYLLSLAIYHRRKRIIPTLMQLSQTALDGTMTHTTPDHTDNNTNNNTTNNNNTTDNNNTTNNNNTTDNNNSNNNNNNDDSIARGTLLELARGHRGVLKKPYPTPLHAAVLINDQNLCETLLSKSTNDIETWCEYKPTDKSHYESEFTSPSTFGCLADAFGGKIITFCPIVCALDLQNQAILKLFLSHGADPWLSSYSSAIFVRAALKGMLRTLIHWPLEEAPLYINRKDKNGKTLLHWAASFGDDIMGPNATYDQDLITDLVKQGAEIDAVDNQGATPLQIAIANSCLAAVVQLCWAGANTIAPVSRAGATSEHYFEGNIVGYATWLSRQRASTKKKAQVAEFLEQWSQPEGNRVNPDIIRRRYEEDLAAIAAETKKPGATSVECADEYLSDIGDDESLHLSEDEDVTADSDAEWEFVPEDPEKL